MVSPYSFSVPIPPALIQLLLLLLGQQKEAARPGVLAEMFSFLLLCRFRCNFRNAAADLRRRCHPSSSSTAKSPPPLPKNH
jgi:hypothetical protein